MIDTDKYEGHTKGPWAWNNVGVLRGEESVLWVDFTEPDPNWHIGSAIHVGKKNKELIADAPLLLEEVKRLRERIEEFEIAVNDMLPMWEPGDYDEVQISGEQKIMVDEWWWRWMATHIKSLLFPYRYHVEGKRYNYETSEWEEEE